MSRDEIVQLLSSAIDFLSDSSLPSELTTISTKLADYRQQFHSITGYLDLCAFSLHYVAVIFLDECVHLTSAGAAVASYSYDIHIFIHSSYSFIHIHIIHHIQSWRPATTLHPFNSLFSRTTWVSRYQTAKNLSGCESRDKGVSGWQWHQVDHMQTICTSLQTDNHTNTSCSSWCPTNSVKPLKTKISQSWFILFWQTG